MKINLNDNGLHLRFAPLSLTRPIGNLRMGIFTNDERWLAFLNGFELSSTTEIGYSTEKYLQGKFPKVENALEINAAVIPNEEVVAAVLQMEENSTLTLGTRWIAKNGT
ncbi:MAG: putative sugar nucleotidyl transferase, partial [Bacteroidota bacterium]